MKCIDSFCQVWNGRVITFAAVWKLFTVFPSSLPSSGSLEGPSLESNVTSLLTKSSSFCKTEWLLWSGCRCWCVPRESQKKQKKDIPKTSTAMPATTATSGKPKPNKPFAMILCKAFLMLGLQPQWTQHLRLICLHWQLKRQSFQLPHQLRLEGDHTNNMYIHKIHIWLQDHMQRTIDSIPSACII